MSLNIHADSANERVELPPVPAWVSALPFLFSSRGRTDDDLVVASALASAAAAMAADPELRDSRSRIAFLLAELAVQHGRRTGEQFGWIPVTRAQLARAAQIKLTKVKRVLGFLLLAGVVELGPAGVRIVDWHRLCKLAAYEPSWASVELPEDDPIEAKPQAAPTLTVAGDQASFV